MKDIYVVSDNIITSLGLTTDENMDKLVNGISGIKQTTDPAITQIPMQTSVVDPDRLNSLFDELKSTEKYTRLEKMVILSIHNALQKCDVDITNERTLVIFSTTKGNIDLLETRSTEFPEDRINLWKTADVVADYFKNPNKPVIISNACISGVTAIITGATLIKAGQYDHVVVAGGDLISEFTPSGFQSFKAISENPCKPFDESRDGITLGEGAGTIILSSDKNLVKDETPIVYRGGANTNDANHISGPSRTGDGLYFAIRNAMNEGEVDKSEIDFISAHGTATVYNDEMESKAISWAELEHVPTNSLKAYWGHTLGAAGIVESIASIHSIKNNYLIGTLGFEKLGVPKELNIQSSFEKAEVNTILKTASGFGGCNASVIFSESK